MVLHNILIDMQDNVLLGRVQHDDDDDEVHDFDDHEEIVDEEAIIFF
jgi:hypothetical protein